MFKKALLITGLMLVLPVFASATWLLNTQVNSGGGSIVSRNKATPQIVSDGPLFKSYTTLAYLPVTVNANTGYTISKVMVNGVTEASSGTFYSTLIAGPDEQSVTATFLPNLLSVTAAAGYGGAVDKTSVPNIYYGTIVDSAIKFRFFPNPSTFRVSNITGVPAGATVSVSSFPAAIGASVTVTFPVNYIFTENVTLNGTFSGPPVAISAPPQTVSTGSIVTLDGSPSTGTVANYTWVQISGPVVSLTASGSKATFTPTVAGTYQFRLTVTGGSTATTTVYVNNSPATVARNTCQNCHQANGVGAANNVFGNWSSSLHKVNFVMCANCHVGNDTGGHPGNLTNGSVNESTFDYNSPYGTGNFCVTCHKPEIITEFAASPHFARAGTASCSFCHVQGVHNPKAACIDCHNPGNSLGLLWPPAGLDFHNDYNGTNLCSNCHNLHNPGQVTGMSGAAHFNNITSVGYPASYLTSKAVCSNCHVSNATNAIVRHQWAKSGHAAFTDPAWRVEDFKTRSGCVQCHTTTGFIAYSTGRVTTAWGVTSDKTKEVLACNGCHSDVANGIVRTVSPVKPFADDPYLNRNAGSSNICMNCHSGSNNGLSITSSDFTNQAFIAPHYLAAGGTLHGKGGYNFPDQTYAFYSSNTHRTIGMGNSNGTGTAGPCIGCHMSASDKHLFKAVSSATTGTIEKITTTVCVNCHTNSLDATQLSTRKTEFGNALVALKAMLASKGFNYSPNYPYFSSTNWGSGQNGTKTMGAAFNYVLLLKEPGAYAHNSAYAKQLAFNSIDYLYNGTITGSIDSAVASLVGNGITLEQAASLISYQNSSSCNSCHTNTSGSHPKHLTSGFGCADCHSATAASNSNLVPGTATHLNGMADLQAGPGRDFSYSSGTCSNISCHNNGNAVWGSTLGCDGCHGYPPAYVNGSPKVNSHANHSFGCGTCHAGTTADGTTISDKTLHVNGVYNVTPGAGATFTYTYAAAGGSCSNISCHGNTAAAWGSTLGCAICHGYPPPNAAGNYAGVDEATSPHMKHAGTGTNYSFACSECHKGNAHGTGTYQDVFIDKSGIIAGSAATYTAAGRTCSSLYCHSNGTPVATGFPATSSIIWGSNKLGCDGCHGNPPAYANNTPKTNSHSKHSFGCGTCHAGTTADGTTISDKSLHVNGTYNVTPGSGITFTYTYSSTGGICSNISCHGNTSAAWGSTLGCTTCHGNPPPIKAGNYTGVDEATSPHMKHAGTGVNYSFACNECHKGNSHGTGTFQDVFIDKSGIIAGSAATYTAAGRTCSTLYCHSNGTSVATGQPATGSVVWGPDKLACNGCHGNPPAYTNNSPKANSHGSHSFGCGTCHAGTTADGTTISDKSLHVNGTYNLIPGAGATFTYTYASNGGTCSNVNCHSGVVAKWGSSVNHIASSGDINLDFLDDSHGGGLIQWSEACATCHYENIAVQHNNNCAICHSGANPPAAGVSLINGRWDKNCSSGSCHPSVHAETNHASFVNINDCAQCHDSSYGFKGCTECHSQAKTLATFISNHPTPVDTPPTASKGNLKLLVHMDEAAWNGTANEVKDSSGLGSHGTAANGANTVADGISGRAGSFNGVNSNVAMQYSPGTVPMDNFTIEAWVKPNSTHEIDPEMNAGSTAGTSGQQYLFWPDNSGSVNSGAGISVGTNGISVYENGASYMPALAVYSGAISSSQWTHIAVVYENKRPSIYVNGALVRIGMPSLRQHVYAPHIIGGGVYGYFSGLADEVAIFNAALTTTEILQHAQQLCTSTSNTAISIRWTSAITSSSYVDYGLTTSYGTTTGNDEQVNTHILALSGLADNTTYHYRVRSSAAGGFETISGDYTFSTPGSCTAITILPTDVSVWPTASGLTYGQALSASTLTGGTASVAGSFAFSTPATVPSAGTAAQSVTFTPTDITNYNTVNGTVDVTVAKATPAILWSNPADISLGTALNATQLNATASVPGTFVYIPNAGTVLGSGNGQVLNVTFTPTDAANYNSTSATVQVNVIPQSGAPASLTIPANSTTGIFQAVWGASDVSGVTYVLDVSYNGGGYTNVYTGPNRFANISGLANGTYSYRVKAIKTGLLDSAYKTANLTVALTCGAPASITIPAANSTGSFQAVWGASDVSGVTYVLDVSFNGGEYTNVYSGPNTYANISGLANGTYSYQVKAIKTGYISSAPTAAATTLTVALACGAPAYLTIPATNSTGSFQAVWGASDVSGVTYVLDVSYNGGGYTNVYTGPNTFANISGLTSGTYLYRVQATKTGYASLPPTTAANTLTVTTVCGAPAFLTIPATNSTGSFQAVWGASDVVGVTYVLDVSYNGGTYTNAYTGPNTSVNISGLANGTYNYRVQATKVGYGVNPPTASTNILTVTLKCGAPASLTIPTTNTTGSFLAVWGASDISGVTYVLDVSYNGGSYTNVYTGPNTSVNISGLTNGTYLYRVQATKSGYISSPFTTAANTLTVTPVCGAPVSITIPVTNTTGSFQAVWGASDVAGATYVLDVSYNGGAYTNVYTGTNKFANINVLANGTYLYRVQATKAGYTSSTPTVSANILTVTLTCGAPASITVPATNTTGSFQAVWGASDVAGVNYVLDVSYNGGAYTNVYTGTNKFANINVLANGTYLYRVQATKAGYTSSTPIVSANILTVTLTCGAPASVTVPATSTTGSFQVVWGASDVVGVTYILQVSSNGVNGTYTNVYTGPNKFANISGLVNGTYFYRVQAIKTGYISSTFTNSTGSCTVTRP